MTLPRRLIVEGDIVSVEPAGDLQSLREGLQHFEGVSLPANQEVVLDAVQGDAMELIVEIDPGAAPMVEMTTESWL